MMSIFEALTLLGLVMMSAGAVMHLRERAR